MQSIHFYIDAIRKNILKTNILYEEINDAEAVLLLKDEQKYLPDTIYIADISEIPDEKAVNSYPQNLFIAGVKKNMQMPVIKGSNTIYTNLSLFDLFAKLNKLVSENRQWDKIFSNPKEEPSYSEWLINTAYDISKASIFVFNAGFQLDMYRLSSDDKCALSKSISLDEYLAPNEISILYNREDASIRYKQVTNCASAQGYVCHSRVLRSQGIIVGYILIIAQISSSIDFRRLSYYLGRGLINFSARQDVSALMSGSHLQNILGSILEHKITDSSVLFQQLAPEIMKQQGLGYVILLTEFENATARFSEYRSLAKQLQRLLNHATSFVYDGRLVTIATHIPIKPLSYDRVFNSEDSESFRNTLKQHNAYTCISVQTSKYAFLFTMYESVRRMLRISRHMEAENDNRLFYAEDNLMFLIMDLAAERFEEVYGHKDMMYVNHPNIMHLYRYDRDNHQDLVTVLYQFLLHGCDVNKTAEATFMHRNTVRRKLELIKSMTNIDFSDGSQTTKYLFAMLTIEYFKRCMGQEYQI